MKVALGSRWRPGPIHRCDSETGFYEFINTPNHGTIEETTQRALLMRVPASVQRRIDKVQQYRRTT